MTRALLLDLGNVVLQIDFRRTFKYWAEQANVEASQLHERWELDAAYEQHEIGAIDFATYVQALGERLSISLPMHHWLQGWNALFVGPYLRVQERLPSVSQQIPLFAFTNTNPTHHAAWSERYPEAFRHFRNVYVSCDIGRRKPYVGAYRHVAADMGYLPSEIVFVDDSEENVAGALEAGMDARWVRSEADVVKVLEEVTGATGG
jgi:putative hydrolase of the HAD superfamily